MFITQLELILNVILIALVLYILYKTVGPQIAEYLYEKITGHKKVDEDELDVLIQRKKDLLRMGGYSALDESPQENSPYEIQTSSKSEKANHYSSKTQRAYAKAFEQCSDKNTTYALELKAMIKLFDQLTWGDPAIKEQLVSSTDKQLVQAPWDKIKQALQLIIQYDLLLRLLQEELPSIKQVKELLALTYRLQRLVKETKERKSHDFQTWAQNLHCRPLDLMLSLEHLLLTGKGEPANVIFDLLLKPQNMEKSLLQSFQDEDWERTYKSLLVTEERKAYAQREEVFKRIESMAHVYSLLSPLPNLNGLEQAYQVLDLLPSSSLDEVKSKYKTLAKAKHPDRIQGVGLPEKYYALAHDNFIQLKEAYELILQQRKAS